MNLSYILSSLLCLSLLMLAFSACRQDQTPAITIDELHEILDTDHDYIILDVRTPEETADGKIAAAQEADVKSTEFTEQLSALDKDKKYIVYCRSGKRSTKACRIMAEHGFEHLLNVKGGYLAYTADK